MPSDEQARPKKALSESKAKRLRIAHLIASVVSVGIALVLSSAFIGIFVWIWFMDKRS